MAVVQEKAQSSPVREFYGKPHTIFYTQLFIGAKNEIIVELCVSRHAEYQSKLSGSSVVASVKLCSILVASWTLLK